MSTTHCALLHALPAALLACLSACASAPPPRLLSLPLPPTAAASPTLSALSAREPASQGILAVRRINIPEYQQSDKVRFRAADSVLGEWPGVVWAERLDSNMTEQLMLRLRQALPGWTVCERNCPAARVSMSLTVDLMPLDYIRGGGELRAVARWMLVPRQTRAVATAASSAGAASAPEASATAAHAGERVLNLPVQPDSPEGHAAALARVLDAVAQGVAADMRPTTSATTASSP